MQIFIIGMPESGRTTVAKSLCEKDNYVYIDATSWLKNAFRPQREDEHPEQYHDAYHHWYLNLIKKNNKMIVNHVVDTINAYGTESNWVIDGINNPHDFPLLFEPDRDFVVFLNRTDNPDGRVKDYETIGNSVIRDYCFWLSAGGMLPKERWIEYNFKMTGGPIEKFKAMGSKNSVFIVNSIDKVIPHLKELIQGHQSPA